MGFCPLTLSDICQHHGLHSHQPPRFCEPSGGAAGGLAPASHELTHGLGGPPLPLEYSRSSLKKHPVGAMQLTESLREDEFSLGCSISQK